MQGWIDRLDLSIQKKHMLSTPFYQAWTRGELTKPLLQEYAKEYYHHVKAFPTYISALHSRCDDEETRRSLLENLIDEEAGHPNHPELWKRFALALNVDAVELETSKPKPAVRQLIEHFRTLCSSAPLSVGIAALYCYESQIPSLCQTKIDGLKKWYGFKNPENYHYFSVHELADVEHSQSEKMLLMKHVRSEKEENQVLEQAEKILNSLWNFLNSFLPEHCAGTLLP